MALASSEAANPHWTPRATPQSLEHIPGENGLPFIGNTFRILRDPPAFIKRRKDIETGSRGFAISGRLADAALALRAWAKKPQ